MKMATATNDPGEQLPNILGVPLQPAKGRDVFEIVRPPHFMDRFVSNEVMAFIYGGGPLAPRAWFIVREKGSPRTLVGEVIDVNADAGIAHLVTIRLNKNSDGETVLLHRAALRRAKRVLADGEKCVICGADPTNVEEFVGDGWQPVCKAHINNSIYNGKPGKWVLP